MAANLMSDTASQSDAMDEQNPYVEWSKVELIAGIKDVQTHIAKVEKELQAIRRRKKVKAKKAGQRLESEHTKDRHESEVGLEQDAETAAKIAQLQARIQQTQAELAIVSGDAAQQDEQKRKRTGSEVDGPDDAWEHGISKKTKLGTED